MRLTLSCSAFFKKFLRDQRGVTAIEYGILAAGLAVVIATAVSQDGAFAQAINDIFGRITANLPHAK